MSVDREMAGEIDKVRGRWVGGSLAVALVIAAIAGGKAGHELNENERASRDAADIAAAERNQRCLELSTRLRQVNLLGLSDRQREDCELEDVEKQLQSAGKWRGGVSLPHDAEIATDSVDIQLPSPKELQASAEENLRQSRETSLPERFEIVAATGGGMALGVLGLSALMVGATAAGGVASTIRRNP